MTVNQKRTIKFIKISSILLGIVFVFLFAVGFLTALNSGTQNFVRTEQSEAFVQGMAYVGAGLAGIGFIGAGVGQGYAAGKASEAVGRNPEAEGKIRNMMIVGAAIAESSALYALVVAILLIFVV